MRRTDNEFLARYGPWGVVAGASEGIGRAFSSELARRGLNLIVVARRRTELEDFAALLRSDYGVEARALVLDLVGEDAAARIEEATEDLDVGMLVYNAAYSLIGPFLDAPVEEHLKELDVNCRTALKLTHLFAKRCAGRGRGGIVLLSSMAGFQGSPLIANYAATKAYNMILAEGLWEELREAGVEVLACCAGATRTPNYQRSGPSGASAMVPVMEAEAVAREALAELGGGPSIIPGRRNRIASFLMRKLLSRRRAISVMGNNMRSMYP